jgi:hypothetical protein
MAERTADVQAHWTRPGVLARIDAALTELGHDPQNLNPEILATVEHLHSGGLATTRDQTKRIALTEESRVLDVGCGIGGPARYLAHRYGCRGRRHRPDAGTNRNCKSADQALQACRPRQVTARQCARSALFRPDLRRGLVASINFVESADVMRAQYHTAGFRILEWMNYSNSAIEFEADASKVIAPAGARSALLFHLCSYGSGRLLKRPDLVNGARRIASRGERPRSSTAKQGYERAALIKKTRSHGTSPSGKRPISPSSTIDDPTCTPPKWEDSLRFLASLVARRFLAIVQHEKLKI